MQELTLVELEQVSGGLCSYTELMWDIAGALGMVGAVFDAAIGATVDVACRITGGC